MFDICKRIQEIDPSLYIVELTEGDQAQWAVMENCQDGVQRLVFKADALDGRVLQKCQRLLAVPFEHRFAEAEKIEAKAKADHHEQELEKLYENVGRPMWSELERCGFIGPRRTSFAKRGVLLGKNRAR